VSNGGAGLRGGAGWEIISRSPCTTFQRLSTRVAHNFAEEGSFCMERRITSWHSPALGMEMPLVAYGHSGYPLLMFPTAAADFLEYERFHLIDSIRH